MEVENGQVHQFQFIDTTPATWWTEQLSNVTILLGFVPSIGMCWQQVPLNEVEKFIAVDSISDTLHCRNSSFMAVITDILSPRTINLQDLDGLPLRL